jgi:predicted nucleotidyltransferase
MMSEGDIQRIVSRIVAGDNPIAVGTFGSYAIGRAHEGSDLDLFVIQCTAQPPSARRRRVMRHLFGVLHPMDPHVFTPEEFEAGAREEQSFIWIIIRQARLYHWNQEAARLVPSLLPFSAKS